MITECPKCQTMQTVDFDQLDEETTIACVGCQSILKLKIVAEIAGLPENIASPDVPPNSFSQEQTDPPRDPIDLPIEALYEQGRLEEASDGRAQDHQENTRPKPKTEDIRKKVLVCIDGEATRELIQELFAGTKYQLSDVPSGIAAFMSMKLEQPDVILIDAGLTDMPGTDLCTQVKQHAELKGSIIILVGSMFEKNAKYRRQPPPLCGADDYIDRYHLQSELLPKIKKHLDTREEVVEKSKIDHDISAPIVQTDPSEIENAERLARIIISEIGLYNREKMEEGIQKNCFHEILKEEINEGRKFFQSRVPASLSASGYFEKALEAFIQGEKMKRSEQKSDLESPPQASPEAKPREIEPIVSVPSIDLPEDQEKDQKEVNDAKRLARIIVSDIVIYNEKKVEDGIHKGNFYASLSGEIKEGRQLFESRVPETLHRRLDYFKEALTDFVKRQHGRANSAPQVSVGADKDPTREISDETPVTGLTAKTESEEPFLLEDSHSKEGESKAHTNAKRLARIIVSDIVIYNERKVDVGIRTGRFFEILKDEIHEGKRLYESRVSEKICHDKNYFQEACDAFILRKKASAA